MPAGPKNLNALSTKTSALLPIILSLAALAVALLSLSINGPKPQSDEGVMVHIFQILIIAEVPFIGFFVLRWIRTNVGAGLLILLIQATALLPVWYFRL